MMLYKKFLIISNGIYIFKKLQNDPKDVKLYTNHYLTLMKTFYENSALYNNRFSKTY